MSEAEELKRLAIQHKQKVIQTHQCHVHQYVFALLSAYTGSTCLPACLLLQLPYDDKR